MPAICWLEQPEQFESLAISLVSIAASQRAADDYDIWLTRLGLGSLATAAPTQPLGIWNQFSRDACILQAAESLGVRLRDLHPVDAAIGLDQSAEFELHFRDSYVPLIRRALHAGQQVIAWRGWPPPRGHAWGIITSVTDSTIVGLAPGHGGEPMALVSAAQQVYVVEESLARRGSTLSSADEFGWLAWMADRQQRNQWAVDPAIRSGFAAFEQWTLEMDRFADAPARTAVARGHRAAISSVAAARRALARRLRALLPNLSPAMRDPAHVWIQTCDRSADRLLETPPDARNVDAEQFAASAGAIARALIEIGELEREAVGCIARFARPLPPADVVPRG